MSSDGSECSRASAAWAVSDRAATSVSESIGRAASSEISVSAAITSPEARIGSTVAVEPRSRNGMRSSWPPPSCAAVSGVSSAGGPGASCSRGCGRLRLERLLPVPGEPRRLLVEARVLDGHRKLPGEGCEKRRFVLAQPAPGGQVGDEQADQLPGRAERNDNSGLDSRLGHGVADRSKSPIARRLGNLDDGPRAQSAEDHIEKPFGDAKVWAGETALGGRLQAAGLPQIDGDTLAAEQLGDAVGRRFERVRKGQLRDRLPDDGEQCSAALQLLREGRRALAGPQDVGGSRTERREPVEVRLVGLLTCRKRQAEATELRLAELDGDDATVENGVRPAVERPVGVSNGRGRIGDVPSESNGRERLRPVRPGTPEDTRAGAADLDREAREALTGPRLLRDGGERTPGHVERRSPYAGRDVPVARIRRPNEQGGMVGDDTREKDVRGGERLAGPRELERRKHPLAGEHGADEHTRRAPARGEPCQLLGNFVALRQLVSTDRAGRKPRTLELRAQRGRRRPDAAGLQVFAAILGNTDDGERGADPGRGGRGQRAERGVEILDVRELSPRLDETLQRGGRDGLAHPGSFIECRAWLSRPGAQTPSTSRRFRIRSRSSAGTGSTRRGAGCGRSGGRSARSRACDSWRSRSPCSS